MKNPWEQIIDTLLLTCVVALAIYFSRCLIALVELIFK